MNIYNKDEVGAWVQSLIDDGNIHAFYVSKYWLRLRREVLEEYKYECQQCKARGYYTRATHVHHVQHVLKYPRLALSKYYIFRGMFFRNLVPLCHDCHEEAHGHRQKESKKTFSNEERW